ncbi:sensor histidine kinase [Alicyclobacillus suci]|uniref:sensor histidine kinase n=1 Tax=Alicyclobacillus suci TaxID=2816080 RepID=UPI001A8C2B33|nr:sensor histidine kinase [Alicyclobacillus suci]
MNLQANSDGKWVRLEQENQRLRRLIKRYEKLLIQSDKMSASKEEVNRNLYEELDVLTKQLEHERNQLMQTNEQLRESTFERVKALSEIAILEERNRIAAEIHDVAGHTLTATVVQMEAIKRLVERDLQEAVGRLEMAQQLVRKSLDEIRASVRKLKDGSLTLEFLPSLHQLIEDTMRHMDVTIEYQIDALPPLSASHQKFLYHALQEGLTNGIRHGDANHFKLNILIQEDYLYFSLQDNGVGFKTLEYGLGIRNMKERAERLAGSCHIFSQENGGCVLVISVSLAPNLPERSL